ncbi:insulinase family protein, partial [bacterium]|nr:insulinase family protein [bacterium]
ELTYKQWNEFHKKFYHPSNAFFFTHGNIPLTELTTRIDDKVLSKFKKESPTKPIPRQTNFESPRTVKYTFPISKSEDTKNKAFVALVWKLIPITDFYENLKFSVLDTILSGSSSSVLNRTLMESGLGSGLAPIGFDMSFSESIFGTGLKDVDEVNSDKIEALILNTLRKICDEGFEESEVHAAIHEMEFNSREIKGDHGLPFGLSLAFRGMKIFLEGGDFVQSLKIDKILEKLRKDAVSPDFFKNLIQKYLLDNPHRITIILAPDSGGMEQQEINRREKLDKIHKDMDPTAIQGIIDQANNLLAHQQDEGDTSCLPHIKLEDINSQPDKTPQEKTSISGVPIYKHPIPTNGISYMTLNFSQNFTTEIPVAGMQHLNILTELGAGKSDYIEMGRLIKERTGGITLGSTASRNIQTGKYSFNATVSGRCLPRNQEAMVDLIANMITSPDLKKTSRISEVLNLRKAYALPHASHNGHQMALLASSRWFCPLRWIGHHNYGMEGILRLLQLTPETIESVPLAISDLLEGLCNKDNLQACFTGDPKLNDQLQKHLEPLISRLWSKDNSIERMSSRPSNASPEAEAWILSTDVSYVAKSFPAVYSEHPDSPTLTVLGSLMMLPMYELIRAQGGAYGAFAIYSATTGLFTMLTYRDPHTAQSLDAFDAVIKKIAKGEFTDEKLHHAIINVISHVDTPPSPREKGLIELERRLTGVTYEHRQRNRKSILNTSRDEIIRVIETYLINPEQSAIAMVVSDKTLENDETKPLNLKRKSLENL